MIWFVCTSVHNIVLVVVIREKGLTFRQTILSFDRIFAENDLNGNTFF